MASHYDYVLVGGGVASVFAAQNIRDTDGEGTILLIKGEGHPPYDRPPLSKNLLLKPDLAADEAYSKFDDFYPKNQIDLRINTRVTAIDRQAQSVTLDDGTQVGYGKLLLATGASAKPLSLPGIQRPNVFYLHNLDESLALREVIPQVQNAVILGAGYIGLEVAAALQQRGLNVTVVERGPHPWAQFAGETAGGFLQSSFEAQGVAFRFGTEAVSLNGAGADGPVQTVQLANGESLPAELVVVGVGAGLNLELAQAAGLATDPHHGVLANAFLQSSDSNIWVAGDIAYFDDIALGIRHHAEHHLNAKWQGQAVGKIMAGGTDPYDRVPYFFSDFLDLHAALRGIPQPGDTILTVGDVAGGEFIELYHNAAGQMTAGLGISHDEPKLDGLCDTLESLLRAKVNLAGRATEIQSPGFDLARLLPE